MRPLDSLLRLVGAEEAVVDPAAVLVATGILLSRFAGLIRQRPGWDTLVYYPDDAICTARLGLTPPGWLRR